MRLHGLRVFWFPKEGNRSDEYEDAYAYHPQAIRVGDFGIDMARIALSDGASESAFAREWANILVRHFVQAPMDMSNPTRSTLDSWLAPAQTEWHEAVPWDRIPWHGEAKTRSGSLATLLGLTIEAAPDDPQVLYWRASAVGDSCLFVVRRDEMTLSFPLDDAARFNNRPDLVCSNPENNSGISDRLHHQSGECEPGDVFILASDDVSRWMLRGWAANRRPWHSVLALKCGEEAAAWVWEQRREGSLGNDDITLVIAEVTEASP